MFTVMKVREDLAPGDYRDPGWYKHPQGTVACEVDVVSADAPSFSSRNRQREASRAKRQCITITSDGT